MPVIPLNDTTEVPTASLPPTTFLKLKTNRPSLAPSSLSTPSLKLTPTLAPSVTITRPLSCEEEISASIKSLGGIPKTVSDSSLVKVDVDGGDMVVLTKDVHSSTMHLYFYELKKSRWILQNEYSTSYSRLDVSISMFKNTVTVGLPSSLDNTLHCAGGPVKLYEKKGSLGWQQQRYHESYDLGMFFYMGKTLDGNDNTFVVTARNPILIPPFTDPQIYFFHRDNESVNLAYIDQAHCCKNIMETNVFGDEFVITADDTQIHNYKLNDGNLEIVQAITADDTILSTLLSENYLVYVTSSTAAAGIRSFNIFIYHRWNISTKFSLLTKLGRLERVEVDLSKDVLVVAPAQTNEVRLYKLENDYDVKDPVIVTLDQPWPASNYHIRISDGNVIAVDGRDQRISYFNIDGCI